MADQEPAQAKFHVLLIGVDNYPGHALYGCVNDIDAVQRVLLGPRMNIPTEQIRRLASPHPGVAHDTLDGEQEANAANIRRELEVLGSSKVAADDRVFIYYSGHGKRVKVEASDGKAFYREALVPVDFETVEPNAFLFDFEINALLGAIVKRTRSVTIMLDSCHSGGAVRDDSEVRGLEPDDVPVADPAVRAGAPGTRTSGPQDIGVDACQVVTACFADEVARETKKGDKRNGLLTRAFVTALDAVPGPDLRVVTWAQIWHGMQADVASQGAIQTPRLNGPPGRAVFAGPPVHGDPGIPVVRDGDRYRIWAGTMAEITEGVELAIYRDIPLYFPRLGSAEDRTERLGVVRVVEAALSGAVAVPIETAFDIPPGARGRIVKAERLPCAVIPPNPAIEKELAASPLVQPVGSGHATPVRLEQRNGRWCLTENERRIGDGAPALFELPPEQISSVRDLLEHYYRYSQPLRIAERAAEARPNGLELRLLSCPDDDSFDHATADVSKLSKVPEMPGGMCRVQAGAPVCVYVENLTDVRLHVALFDVAAGGEVQLLGEETLEPKAFYVLWDLGNEPLRMWPADGVGRSRDRLVAIGRTSRQALDHLCVDQTFAQVVARGEGADKRAGGGPSTGGPTELWTAATKIIEISAT